MGTEKAHNFFFNISFLPLTKTPQFGGPRKSLCASCPGKEHKQGTHINFYEWNVGANRGLQTARFGPQKVWFIVFFLPLHKGWGPKCVVCPSKPIENPRVPLGHMHRVTTQKIPRTPAQLCGPQTPRRDPAISLESLTEGCAPRMVTLGNFRRKQTSWRDILGFWLWCDIPGFWPRYLRAARKVREEKVCVQ